MLDPEPFDDPGPLEPRPPSRARRVATVAILVLLIVSMVFLAFVSGRGLVMPATPDAPEPTLREAGGSARPAGPPLPRMAVVDAAGRLITADAAGVASAPIGTAGVAYSFPAWSPGGERIAVIAEDGATGLVHVFGVGRDGGDPVGPAEVYDSAERPPFYLSWSPDGSRLSFLTREADGLALRVAPADASALATVVRQGAPMYWAWTGAGGLLVHSGGEAPDAFVGEIGLDGTPIEPTVARAGGFRAPAISADGAFRGYVAPGEGTPYQVVVETRDGSSRHEVDVHGAAAIDFGPSAPDLAFIAPDGPGREISLPVGPLRLVSAATGDVRTLIAGPVLAFFWAPDGRTIAALRIAEPTDDTVASLRAAPMARLVRTQRTATIPAFGVWLDFVDTQSGAVRSQLAVQVGDLFATQVLPYFDQYALSHRLWSPDSRAIALPVAAADGTTVIVAIPADGGDATRIADGVAAAWSP